MNRILLASALVASFTAAFACVPIPTATQPLVIACWDLNENGVADADEDANADGSVNVLDCRGPAGATGADGANGVDGADGMDGMDGMDGPSALAALFGDGSSGARNIGVDARFETQSDANQLWTDFGVSTGVILRVQSGTVIRCSGMFVNNGTIIVENGAQGGDRSSLDSTTRADASRPASIGINTLAAGSGEVGDATAVRGGGAGGDGISEFESLVTLRVGIAAGGGGGAAFSSGAAGGGSFTVFASGPIQNNGVIVADGAAATDSGGGGGGGGVIMLVSADSVTNASGASLLARGGDGGPSDAEDGPARSGLAAGPGGGGGGGLIHLIAPDIEHLGSASVLGGSAGSKPPGTNITAPLRSGGAGGGGSAGAGGAGGAVPAGASAQVNDAGGGSAGFFLRTVQNPRFLFP